MKLVITVVGVIAILMGAIWILQGLNVLPGSFMTGHIIWTGWGAVLVAIGAGLLVWNNRRPKA